VITSLGKKKEVNVHKTSKLSPEGATTYWIGLVRTLFSLTLLFKPFPERGKSFYLPQQNEKLHLYVSMHKCQITVDQ
jgi:hypothetical protein